MKRCPEEVTSMLIADDIILLAPTELDLQCTLEHFTVECKTAGMKISTSTSKGGIIIERELHQLLIKKIIKQNKAQIKKKVSDTMWHYVM